ncbi:tellurite resistance protein TerB [Roseovarius sp. A-2]|uniref:tellurite resistance TerB family protein n=1 Tax=Roseovarius sp. A-2 TaxID=1570360 RepID=UPI0009B578C0|nr:TerB family tellurite resistance protein [Roseovarius sp. A-2]GAW35323.1 tellurite resistance protein TerB [Roseovarius sp. A-2]
MSESWFEGVNDVVEDELRFKVKLGIGEDAYTSTRLKKAVFEAWDVAGVAATGAQLASSALVAQKFFAAPSLLASIGIGTATAATPIGWVVAASVISGGAWLGITRYLKDDGGKVKVIPEFINTPLDVLGLGLFDLIAPLAIKVAAVDGHVDDSELAAIKKYFVRTWGYSEPFVERGLAFVSAKHGDYHIKTAAAALGAFARDNPDCRADRMLADILAFLREVMEADGRIDEREEMAIERIEKVLNDEMRFSVSRTVAPVGTAASQVASGVGAGIKSASRAATTAVKTASQVAGGVVSGITSAIRKPLKRDKEQ